MPDTKHYFLRPFSATTVWNADLILSSEFATCAVADNAMQEALLHLSELGPQVYSTEELTDALLRFGLDSEAAIAFLVEQAQILKPVRLEGEFQALNFISDAPDALSDLIDAVKSFSNVHITRDIRPTEFIDRRINNVLHVVYLKNYNPDKVRAAMDQVAQQPSHALLSAYYLGDFFFIDNLYVSSFLTPCHFCRIGRWENLENRHEGLCRTDSSSWYALYTRIIRNELPIPASRPKTSMEIGLALFYLCMALKRQLSFDPPVTFIDNAAESIELDLRSGRIRYETIPHWNLCSCLVNRDIEH